MADFSSASTITLSTADYTLGTNWYAAFGLDLNAIETAINSNANLLDNIALISSANNTDIISLQSTVSSLETAVESLQNDVSALQSNLIIDDISSVILNDDITVNSNSITIEGYSSSTDANKIVGYHYKYITSTTNNENLGIISSDYNKQ